MSVILDANVVVALVTDSYRHTSARERFDRWLTEGEDFHAPDLFTYELASALLRKEVGSDNVWSFVTCLDMTFHPPSHGANLVAIARRLHRRSAYDAAYIDLALELNAELWTLDGKLARNAESVGFPVRLVC